MSGRKGWFHKNILKQGRITQDTLFIVLISNIFIHLTPFPWFLATNNQSFLSLLKSFIYSIYAKPTYCQNIPLKLQMLLQTNIITPPSIYLTLKPSWVSKSSYQTNCNLKNELLLHLFPFKHPFTDFLTIIWSTTHDIFTLSSKPKHYVKPILGRTIKCNPTHDIFTLSSKPNITWNSS